jgi:hypothetical protein
MVSNLAILSHIRTLSFPLAATFASMPFCDTSLSIADRVKDLISRLTLEEKAALMDNDAANISRLGLPEYQWYVHSSHRILQNRSILTFILML